MDSPEKSPTERRRLDRRTALKWMLAATATLYWLDRAVPGEAAVKEAKPAASGYGSDPDLTRDYKPGDLWPLTLTDAQRLTAIALCDVIIPADDRSPSASSLGVHDFIDEWISAPYPEQQKDRPLIVEGLVWIDSESQRRFNEAFAALGPAQVKSLCDDICYVRTARPALKGPALFFAKFRDLTAGGYYTTKEGMKEIGYTGNIPSASFDGPPLAVLQKIGLA
jgi:hypothetical protein